MLQRLFANISRNCHANGALWEEALLLIVRSVGAQLLISLPKRIVFRRGDPVKDDVTFVHLISVPEITPLLLFLFEAGGGITVRVFERFFLT